MFSEPFPGQHVVLLPSGLLGRVAAVEFHPVPAFRFDHILKSEWIVLGDQHRFRPVMSLDAAIAIEQQLLESPAIPELASWPSETTADTISRRLDLYLAGTEIQRLAAYATVLDWANAAIARGEMHGLWRGVLTCGRDCLLGELALVRGLDPMTYEQQLLARRSTATRRASDIPAPFEPPPPIRRLGFHPDLGRHVLGTIDVPRDLLVTQDFSDISPDTVEDGGFVDARPGRWFVIMHVADDYPTPGLAAAIRRFARSGEQRREILERLYRSDGKWLVLVHESAMEFGTSPPTFIAPPGAAITEPTAIHRIGGFLKGLLEPEHARAQATAREEQFARFLTSASDLEAAMAKVQFGVCGPGDAWLELDEIGICHVEGGLLAIFAAGPSEETARAVEYHPVDGTNVWPWGVIHALGGDGPVPVYGSLSRPRDIIVIPA